jgi:transcriptional regulator with XRE-family HTH domain
MAERLKMTQDMLSRILSSKRKPTPTQRATIEDEYPDVFWRLFDEELDGLEEEAS